MKILWIQICQHYIDSFNSAIDADLKAIDISIQNGYATVANAVGVMNTHIGKFVDNDGNLTYQAATMFSVVGTVKNNVGDFTQYPGATLETRTRAIYDDVVSMYGNFGDWSTAGGATVFTLLKSTYDNTNTVITKADNIIFTVGDRSQTSYQWSILQYGEEIYREVHGA